MKNEKIFKEVLKVISIAAYSQNEEMFQSLSSMVEEFFLQQYKKISSLYRFDQRYKSLDCPESFDVFMIDLEADFSYLTIDNSESYFIFIGNNLSKIVLNNNACHNFYVKTPVDKEKIFQILNYIKHVIQKEYVTLSTIDGDTRLRLDELNYIDIQKRNLCYHLTDKTSCQSSTLTTSFLKAIQPLDQHKSLLFIKPSLLINILKVKTIDTNRIIFDNGDIYYCSTPQRKIIEARWHYVNDFINTL